MSRKDSKTRGSRNWWGASPDLVFFLQVAKSGKNPVGAKNFTPKKEYCKNIRAGTKIKIQDEKSPKQPGHYNHDWARERQRQKCMNPHILS